MKIREKEWGTLWVWRKRSESRRWRKRRESVVIFIAQTRCMMGEVHQHRSPLNRRCSRGESASIAENVSVREVSAHCT